MEAENPMPTHHVHENQGSHSGRWLAIALGLVVAIATVCLTHSATSLPSFSPLSGLMILKATAQDAIPYEVAIANPKPTLIEFYADWCTTCQALASTLQSVHHQFGDRVNFVMLDIDDPQWQAQVQQFRVSGVPHLALLNSDQTVAEIFVGQVPEQVLSNRVAKLLEPIS